MRQMFQKFLDEGSLATRGQCVIFLAGSSFFFSLLVFGYHLKNTPYMLSKFTAGTGWTNLGGNLKGFGRVVSARQTVIILHGNRSSPCVPLSRGGPKAPIRTENEKSHV